MADKKLVDPEKQCGFCKRPVVLKKVKCTNCEVIFHTSCSTKKTKKCCEKQNLEEETQMNVTEEDNDLSDNSIIEETNSDNANTNLLSEMNKDLREHIKLLKEKIRLLEDENTNLKKILEEKHTMNNTKKYTSHEDRVEEMKCELRNLIENKFCHLSNEINGIKNNIKDLNVNIINPIKNVQKKPEAQKPTTTPKERSKPVTPKQTHNSLKEYKTATPKQFSKVLENAQLEKMNSLIYMNASPGPSTEEKQAETTYKNNENEEWKTVQKRRKNKNKRNIGESEDNNENFKGVEPKVWLYLYRVLKCVTEEDIRQYIKKKTDLTKNSEIIVKQITSQNTQFNSFMVAAEFKYKDIFYDPKFWPKGVGYKRFDFKRYYEMNKQDKPNNARPVSFLE